MCRLLTHVFSFPFISVALLGLAIGLGGAADSADRSIAPPNWMGTWEVVEVTPKEEAPPEGMRSYLHITQDSVISIRKMKDQPCKSQSMAVICTDGSLVSTKVEQQKLYQFRFSVSGDTLTAVPVNTDDPVTMKVVSADVDPMSELGCTGTSSGP